MGQSENILMRVLTWALAAGMSLVMARAGSGAADSPEFALDTRSAVVLPGADSGIFTLDTRSVATGTVAGVLSDSATGSPLIGAQVRIDRTAYSATTDSAGRFSMVGVPVGSGYWLQISAADHETLSRTLTVLSGANDLGVLQLSFSGSGLRLVDLEPPVNDDELVLQAGGVGYRYYRVVSSDGQGRGGVQVSVRQQGGSALPQDGDVSDYWAGRVAGVSDADGIVRVRVPANAIGGVGALRVFEVLESGRVWKGFAGRVAGREYDRAWRQKVGGGLSGKIKVFRLGASGAFETEVHETQVNGTATHETITRRRQGELRAGVEVGGGLTVGEVVRVGTKVGSGGYAGIDVGATYGFENPSTTDRELNAVKLYVALGDYLRLSPGLGSYAYPVFQDWYEAKYLTSLLEGVDANVRMGLYSGAEVSLKLGGGRQVRVGGSAEESVEVEGISGYAEHYKPERWRVYCAGAAVDASASAWLGAYLNTYKKEISSAGAGFFASADQQTSGEVWRRESDGRPGKVVFRQSAMTDSRRSVKFGDWRGVSGSLFDNDLGTIRYSETLQYDLPNGTSDLDRLTAEAPAWRIGFTSGAISVLNPSLPAQMYEGLWRAGMAQGRTVDYSRGAYAAITDRPVDLELDLDVVIAGLGATIEAEFERGAEVEYERGRIWQLRRLPLAVYSDVDRGMIPSESLPRREARWFSHAAPEITWIYNQVRRVVDGLTDTVVGAAGATWTFLRGVFADGVTLVIETVDRPSGGGANSPQVLAQAGLAGKDGWPPSGASNYVYGLGGVYRIRSDSPLQGTGELRLRYTAADVVGLDESRLRIYRLADGADHWELVGGTVHPLTKEVVATITNLGTFTLAPPLPTGHLQLSPSVSLLPADGVSTLTVSVTNLVLNTGERAVEPWLFTVEATGLQVVAEDADPDNDGLQLASTNGSLGFVLRAPTGGTHGRVTVESVAGDAAGSLGVDLLDAASPAVPSGVQTVPGQSRIWVSWAAGDDPDLVGYRVYYRAGSDGPPYDGIASVEGSASPVEAGTTNLLLRGLTVGTRYFVAVSAVDTSGNESSTSPAVQVVTAFGPPASPVSVALRVGDDGTNVLMWARSEDDGYNDRDVVRYEVWRAELPGGDWVKISELPPASETYLEASPAVAAGKFLRYGVSAVDADGMSSSRTLSNRYVEGAAVIDNDGDGLPDAWEEAYGLNANDPADAAADTDGDGLTNAQEYAAGSNPVVVDTFGFLACRSASDGIFELTVFGLAGRSGSVERSPDLLNWDVVTNLTFAPEPIRITDPQGGQAGFYRLKSW